MTNGLDSLSLLPLYLGLGFLLRAVGRVPFKYVRYLNLLIIYGPLPAVTFLNIHDLHLTGRAIYPMISAWILFLSAWAAMAWLGKRKDWSRPTQGAAILMAGLANTSFIGFPVLRALYGEAAVQIGVLVDQPGSFLVVSTLGLVVAATFSGDRAGAAPGRGRLVGRILTKIVTFPAFIALLIALLLRSFTIPDEIVTVFRALGAMLSPLALISVGLQLDPKAILSMRRSSEESGALFWSLLHKLILGPALIALLFRAVFGLRGMEYTVSVLEVAMAPMITAGIIAAEYGLNPRLVSATVSIGILLSGGTLAVWAWILALLG